MQPERWMCRLCGRDKFDRSGQPHRCVRGFMKRWNKTAPQYGLKPGEVWTRLEPKQ